MSNGTTQQQTAGRMKFKPRTSSLENHPDAPEGGWEFTIPKGKVRFSTTQKGDPQLVIPHKLTVAKEDKNESFQGTEVQQRIIFFDESTGEGKRNSNMQRDRLRQLCTAVGVEFADVYPTNIEDDSTPSRPLPSCFKPLADALEGTSGECWTVHRTSAMGNGETRTNTNINYKEPGAGLVTRGEESDDDDRPSKKAAAKKGGKR